KIFVDIAPSHRSALQDPSSEIAPKSIWGLFEPSSFDAAAEAPVHRDCQRRCVVSTTQTLAFTPTPAPLGLAPTWAFVCPARRLRPRAPVHRPATDSHARCSTSPARDLTRALDAARSPR